MRKHALQPNRPSHPDRRRKKRQPHGLQAARRRIARANQLPGKPRTEKDRQPGDADDRRATSRRIIEPRRWPALELAHQAQHRDRQSNHRRYGNQAPDAFAIVHGSLLSIRAWSANKPMRCTRGPFFLVACHLSLAACHCPSSL